jgi:uncharacterized protein with NRDE domain
VCLIVFAWETHPDYRLILAANRDEFHERPTQALHWWPDRPEVLAGRDLQAGGTWLAAGRSGRVATVTNYREQQSPRGGLRSRGELVSNFVSANIEALEFSSSLQGDRYAGFSLLTIDQDGLCYVSNRGDRATTLQPGIYGLSNVSLDTPWPKLLRTREALAKLVKSDRANETELFRLMADRKPAAIAEVEGGSESFAEARALTAPFILTPRYGTRSTTVLFWDNAEKICLAEKRFDAAGIMRGESRFSFIVDQNWPSG